jgi:GAF domain/ANTAR domain
MVRRGGDNRLAKVRMWVAELAANLGEPVSVGLLCKTAMDRLGVSGAVLTVDTSAGWSETRYSTGMLDERLAELEVTVGEGPCTDAARDGGPVLVADLDAPESQRRWPLFASLAVESGAGALFALPLCVGAIRVGILALHRIEAGGLEPATLADALAFAAMSLRLLLDEQAGLGAMAGELTDSLPLHNPQLHQATGMISAQLDVAMDDAFARLRARAFAEQRPLSELAAAVVARRLRFEPAGEVDER